MLLDWKTLFATPAQSARGLLLMLLLAGLVPVAGCWGPSSTKPSLSSSRNAAIDATPGGGDLVQGLLKHERGDSERAIASLKKAVKAEPDNIVARVYLAMAQRDASKLDYALEQLDEAIELPTRTPWTSLAYLLRGECFVEQRQLEQALDNYSAALEEGVLPGEVLFRRGEVLGQLGKWSEADADFSEVIRLDPNSAEALTRRGNARLVMNQLDKAADDCSAAIGKLHDYGPAFSIRGQVYLRQTEYDRALADLDMAIRLRLKTPKPYDPELAETYYCRGLAQQKKGDYLLALADFRMAISFDPEHALALDAQENAEMRIAEAKGEDRGGTGLPAVQFEASLEGEDLANLSEQEQRGLVRSLDAWTRRLKENPKDAEAYFGRGHVYFYAGKTNEALADFHEAIRLNPDDATWWYARGLAHHRNEQFEEAVADYSATLERKPEFVHALNNRGLSLAHMEDNEAALADFKQAIRLEPEWVQPYCNVGDLYSATKQFDLALLAYNKALLLDTDCARAYFGRARAYLRKDQLLRGLGDVEKALLVSPDFADALQLRGEMRQRQEDYAGADDDFRRAKALRNKD